MTETRWHRTSKGSKRHTDWACANFRRDIMLGGVIEIPAGEIEQYEACSVCSGGVATAKQATDKPAGCSNSGVINPKRIYSTCRDCGKEGKVNRRTGSIRAH